MRYPDDIVQEVIALNDIVAVVSGYIKLTQRSGNFFGQCPFHNEDTPSLCVSQDKQIFYCFGCNTGGSVLSFIMKIENVSFRDGLKFLASRANFTLPEKAETQTAKQARAVREKSAELNKLAAQFYHQHLISDAPDAEAARNYLAERGIKPALIRRFGIGLAPQKWDGLILHMPEVLPVHLVEAGLASQSRTDATRYFDRFRARLMFPIIDVRNRVVGFGGRIMSQDVKPPDKSEAKYLNTPETSLFHKSDNLYGLNLARKFRSAELIVVEGYMDVIAMHQYGFKNTVAVLGTAINDSHVRLLKNSGCTAVVLMMDGDNAGVRATLRAIPVLVSGGIKVRVLNISNHDPIAKDPDEYLAQHGAVKLAGLIAQARTHISYQIGTYKANHDISLESGKIDFVKEAVALVATLSSAIETEVYVKEVAEISGFSPVSIHSDVAKVRGNIAAPLVVPRMRTQAQGAGIVKAKQVLMHIILSYASAALALHSSGYITAQELENATYSNLYELAVSNAQQGRKMSPAEIISLFEDEEELRTATTIFLDAPEYSSKGDIEKALNDTAYKIKSAWATSKKSQIDVQTLQALVRNQPNISI